MSLLKANSVQIGQSATATQNFTLSVPSSPDGTIKLARGNSGATTADVLTVDASGNVTTTLANGIVTPAKLSQPMTLGTAVATTSGTFADITGIPSWAKRITLSIYNISFAGADNGLIQLGVGTTPTTTGYNSVSQYLVGSVSSGAAASTSGFIWLLGSATYVFFGTYVFTKHNGNTWVGSGVLSCNTGTNFGTINNGIVTLSGDLGMIRLLGTLGSSLDGTSSSINVLYEG